MFYTPSSVGYVENINMMAGMKQEIIFGELNFALSLVRDHDMTKNTDTYWPMIILMNYSAHGTNVAFISYCVFTVDSEKNITGARSLKQLILVSSTAILTIPFDTRLTTCRSRSRTSTGSLRQRA